MSVSAPHQNFSPGLTSGGITYFGGGVEELLEGFALQNALGFLHGAPVGFEFAKPGLLFGRECQNAWRETVLKVVP